MIFWELGVQLHTTTWRKARTLGCKLDLHDAYWVVVVVVVRVLHMPLHVGMVLLKVGGWVSLMLQSDASKRCVIDRMGRRMKETKPRGWAKGENLTPKGGRVDVYLALAWALRTFLTILASSTRKARRTLELLKGEESVYGQPQCSLYWLSRLHSSHSN